MSSRKLKYIMVMLFTGVTIQNAFAQNSPFSLKIGDRVPEMTFEIMNNDKESISLSSLKGKLVILDFWSTGCTACIKKFPYLDSLHVLFGDRIKIILVDPKRSGDDDKKVNRIFEVYKKNYGKPLGLSSSIYDTTAVKYFPHKAQSHFAWIDGEGIVRAISGYVKKEDVALMLAGKNPDVTQKNDFLVSQKNEALFTLDVSNIKFKSMLTRYLEGTDDFGKEYAKPFVLSDLTKGIRFVNLNVLQILNKAYNYFPEPNLVVIEGVNRADFICPDGVSYDVWIKNNGYCYELIASAWDRQAYAQQIISDIEKAFHIKTSTEKRKVLCWVVKMDERQMKKVQLKNKALKDLISLSNIASEFQKLDIPLVVDTKFDIDIFSSQYKEYAFKDLDETDLKKFVKDYGLTLVKEDREQKVFVIKRN